MVTFTVTITRHFMQAVDFISCHKHIILISYVLTVHFLNVFGKDNNFFLSWQGKLLMRSEYTGWPQKAVKNIIASLLIAPMIWYNVSVYFIRFELRLLVIPFCGLYRCILTFLKIDHHLGAKKKTKKTFNQIYPPFFILKIFVFL